MEPERIKPKEVKPALSGYIKDASNMLKGSDYPDVRVVHDVRVLMKKSRAVLKLIGTQLDKESLKRDLLALRTVGRMMADWRESSVLRKTLKELKKKHADIFKRLEDYEKLTVLLIKPGLPENSEVSVKEGVDVISDLLKRAGYRIRFQTMNNLDQGILLRELYNSYKIVIDTYLTCRNNPKQENLHEFRKKSKDFLYQLYFFRPFNSSAIKALEKKLNTLTRNLGKYNDLAQLIKNLGYKYDHTHDFPALDELIIKIREEQDNYLSRVWPVAYKIFCPGQNLKNVLGFELPVI